MVEKKTHNAVKEEMQIKMEIMLKGFYIKMHFSAWNNIVELNFKTIL